MNQPTRREFLQHSTGLLAGVTLAGSFGLRSAFAADAPNGKKPLFKISCTEYSLHNMIGKGELDNLDYAAFVQKTFGINAVEYWNRPFFQQGSDEKYLGEMRERADDAGVKGTCILIDGEGEIANAEESKRVEAVNKHKRWVEAAKILGCDSIRVNLRSSGSEDEQRKYAIDGMNKLCEFAEVFDVAIIVENHGGLSSNGKWLASVMKGVNRENAGTLPDFGNFHGYDRYLGVKETMPYAKLVSAKSHDFNDKGEETKTDYLKMMKIVVESGYNGYVGIEYEGRNTPEVEGVKLTHALLKKVRKQLSEA